MAKERQKEIGTFMLIGLVATAVDYVLLNLFAVGFKLPVILANSLSAPFSSIISYKLNKRVVFDDRMYGKRKTLVLYIAIIGFGILVIQNVILHFVSGGFSEAVAKFMDPLLAMVGLEELTERTIAINVGKVVASLVAAVWNYVLLRRFVFVTKEEAGDS